MTRMRTKDRCARGFAPRLLLALLLCSGGGTVAARATVCANPPLPPAPGVCAVTTGDAGLLLRGAVLVPGDVLENGHLLIDAAGLISCAACDCSAAPGFATATRVDCPDGVIAPGFVNANDYLNYSQNAPGNWGDERYEHRHDWRLGQNGHTQISAAAGGSAAQERWGELRQVLGGATSIRGGTAEAGLARNLDSTAGATEGLASVPWSDVLFPLGDAGGERLEDSCAYPALPMAPIDSPYWINVAEGLDDTARNEFVCLSDAGGVLGGVDVIADAMLTDAIGVTAADVAEMSAGASTVVWSPRSNLALYGRTVPVTELHRRGVPIALGTDWIVTGSMSMGRELACADDYNRRFAAGRLSDRELFEAATRSAADASAMSDEIGVLAAGRKGDVAVWERSGRDPYRAVIEAHPSRLGLVLRGGKPLLGEDAAMALWPVAVCADDAIDLCGRQARPCLLGEISTSYADLATANAASYPALQCGVVANEPPCRPQRLVASGGFPTHDGVPRGGDFDGDGYTNGGDNCPVIFNPANISPAAQADADADGAGDACDFCSTSASATGCGESSASDLVAGLTLPGTLLEGQPFVATFVVSNTGGAAATGRAVLPTLRELGDVSWSCAGTGGGVCPASGIGGLDAAVSLPPGATASFAIIATHPGPPTQVGEHFIAVASAIPVASLGDTDSLDNYDATASIVLGLLFADGFESADTTAWSLAFP